MSRPVFVFPGLVASTRPERGSAHRDGLYEVRERAEAGELAHDALLAVGDGPQEAPYVRRFLGRLLGRNRPLGRVTAAGHLRATGQCQGVGAGNGSPQPPL